MKANFTSLTKWAGACVFLSLISLPAGAQFLRTSYFMEGATNRLQLNPALQPSRGYVNIPVIGSLNVSATSNSLGTEDIIDVCGNSGDFFDNDDFFNRLSKDNRMNVSLSSDVISFGFYRGKGFWSASVGLRADIDASVPKSMFGYLRDMDNENFDVLQKGIDIRNEKLNINAYTEIGVGYSRPINDRLTVGGKVKVLMGVGNLNMNVQRIGLKANIPEIVSQYSPDMIEDIERNPEYYQEILHNNPNLLKNYSAALDEVHATINTSATLEGSLKGLELKESDPDEQGRRYVDDIDMNGFGIAGYGGAIDLGVTYKILNNLTVSAAVIDLGFISWSKESTTIATADRDLTYDKNNYQDFLDRTQNGEVFDFDLIGLHIDDKTKSRTTSLASTLVLGAEYGFFNNKLTAGLLSTTRFGKMRTVSELTISANYRPNTWVNAALSYSMIQTSGKSFGLAIKAGPFMIGTDYMYLGSDTKCVNGYLGISVPLGKKKRSSCCREIILEQ